MKKKRTSEQWQNVFQQHRASGLSVVAFCQQHHIPVKTFYNTRKKFEDTAAIFVKANITETQQVEPLSPHSGSITLQHQQTLLSL